MTLDDTYAVTLTRAEACYLSDAIPMHSPGPPDQEITGRPFPNLFLQIGSALLELRDPTKCSEITLKLTEAELWMIREVAKSSVTVGTEKVGVNLAHKAYEGLLHIYNARAFAAGLVLSTKNPDYNKAAVLDGLWPRIEAWERQEAQDLAYSSDGGASW